MFDNLGVICTRAVQMLRVYLAIYLHSVRAGTISCAEPLLHQSISSFSSNPCSWSPLGSGVYSCTLVSPGDCDIWSALAMGAGCHSLSTHGCYTVNLKSNLYNVTCWLSLISQGLPRQQSSDSLPTNNHTRHALVSEQVWYQLLPLPLPDIIG